MRGLLLGTCLILVAVGGLTAVNLTRDFDGFQVDWRLITPPPREVALESPTRAALVETITASGTIEPVEEAEIAPQIVGRVVEVLVEDGDRVQKGDLLLRLDETEARARLESSVARIERLEAAIQQARTNLEKAVRDLERTQRLTARNASSATELLDMRSEQQNAESALLMASRELAESQAMRKTAEQEVSYTRIVAPMDGVVSGCDVEVGEVVIAGTTNLPGSTLMRVSDLGRMQVRADVDETDVLRVAPDQPTRVYLQADLLTPIPGRVERVSPQGKLAADVVTFETIIAVDSPAGATLRPGMTATVEIEVQRGENALSVPVQAVVQRRRKDLPDSAEVRDWIQRNPLAPGERAQEAESRYVKIVFVQVDGVARARPVEVGLSDERRVEIRAGLREQDLIIVGPFRALDELKDGDAVRKAPETEPTDEAA